MALMTLLHIIH